MLQNNLFEGETEAFDENLSSDSTCQTPNRKAVPEKPILEFGDCEKPLGKFGPSLQYLKNEENVGKFPKTEKTILGTEIVQLCIIFSGMFKIYKCEKSEHIKTYFYCQFRDYDCEWHGIPYCMSHQEGKSKMKYFIR